MIASYAALRDEVRSLATAWKAIAAGERATIRHPSLCEQPTVSVVLGSYNRVDLLRLAIESVRVSLEGIAGEIIVIDGGSTDGSTEWLLSQPDIITIVQNNRFHKDGKQYRRKSWGGFMNIAFRAAVSLRRR